MNATTQRIPTSLVAAALICLTTGITSAQEIPTRKYAGGLNRKQTRSLTVMTKSPLATRSFDNLPARISYEPYCPSVGDQGRQQTSVAFATAYYLRTIMEGKTMNLIQPAKIDAIRFSPTFVYDKIRDPKDVNCQGGGTIEEALDVLKTDGVPSLKKLGYPQCNQAIPPDVLTEAARFKISDYQLLFGAAATPAQKIQAVRKALSEGNPVVMGISAPLSFEEVRAVWEPAPNEKANDGLYNQALCVIGYDDERYGGAFRIVNSWTTNWGEKGFCWIPYASFGTFVFNAFQVYGANAAADNNTGPVVLTGTNQSTGVSKTGGRHGAAELKLNDGSPMEVTRQATRGLKLEADPTTPTDIQPYRTVNVYRSGTRFKFYLNNSENSYIYALTTDKRGKVKKLVPFDELTSPLLGPNTVVVYPAENRSIVMDKHKGGDDLLILFAKRPLNVDGLVKTLNRQTGSLGKRVTNVLSDQLIRPDQIIYTGNQLTFEVKPDATGNVVPILVELQHN